MTSRTNVAQRASSASLRGAWRGCGASSKAQSGAQTMRSFTVSPASAAISATRSRLSNSYGPSSVGFSDLKFAEVEMIVAPASFALPTRART